VNKEVLFGIIYNPIQDELFTAQKGQGAKRNGAPIQVSKCNTLKVVDSLAGQVFIVT
jgi:fructose-1,6-bisphosphatase/inositol monophosphatase family enzyme